MNYLYYNEKTNEFGISLDELKNRLPNVSISSDIKKLEDFIRYEKSPQPVISKYQIIQEIFPVEGIQSWSIVDKEITVDIINNEKIKLKDKITSKRWDIESNGLIFPNNIKVKTSKDDQDRVLSVIINAERNKINEIDFKSESGWVKISLFALKQLARQLTFFVQNCFKVEKYHHDVVDTLTTIESVLDYDYNVGWDFIAGEKPDVILHTYSLSNSEIIQLLYSNFIFPKNENNLFKVSFDASLDVQCLVDRHFFGMVDLLPSQFYFLLAKSNLDNAINTLLDILKTEDINKYSTYKSYLQGARFFEFSKAYSMYIDIRPKLLLIDSQLDFNLNELKTLWIEASAL